MKPLGAMARLRVQGGEEAVWVIAFLDTEAGPQAVVIRDEDGKATYTAITNLRFTDGSLKELREGPAS